VVVVQYRACSAETEILCLNRLHESDEPKWC
jgi:hypothetical protein